MKPWEIILALAALAAVALFFWKRSPAALALLPAPGPPVAPPSSTSLNDQPLGPAASGSAPPTTPNPSSTASSGTYGGNGTGATPYDLGQAANDAANRAADLGAQQAGAAAGAAVADASMGAAINEWIFKNPGKTPNWSDPVWAAYLPYRSLFPS